MNIFYVGYTLQKTVIAKLKRIKYASHSLWEWAIRGAVLENCLSEVQSFLFISYHHHMPFRLNSVKP